MYGGTAPPQQYSQQQQLCINMVTSSGLIGTCLSLRRPALITNLDELAYSILSACAHRAVGEDGVSFDLLRQCPKDSSETRFPLYYKIQHWRHHPFGFLGTIYQEIYKRRVPMVIVASYRLVAVESHVTKLCLVLCELSFLVYGLSLVVANSVAQEKVRHAIMHLSTMAAAT